MRSTPGYCFSNIHASAIDVSVLPKPNHAGASVQCEMTRNNAKRKRTHLIGQNSTVTVLIALADGISLASDHFPKE